MQCSMSFSVCMRVHAILEQDALAQLLTAMWAWVHPLEPTCHGPAPSTNAEVAKAMMILGINCTKSAWLQCQ